MATIQRTGTPTRATSTATTGASLGAAGLATVAGKIKAAAGDDKDFPDLTSGNRGVRGYELTGARAQLCLDLAGDGVKLKAGERVVGLLVTEDESWVKLAIVNDKTLAVRDGGEFNLNNAPMTTKEGDEIDAFHGYYLLLKGAPELPLAHGDNNSDWTIADYKGDGPARLPRLELPKPVAPRPPPPDFIDAAGATYLAGKVAQHAGGRLPSLTGGTRGSHAYEVPPAEAAVVAKALNGAFPASMALEWVFVAILETGAKPQLSGLAFLRDDLGKAGIRHQAFDAKKLDGAQIATLLAKAKELPVTGRIEGFSLDELSGRRPTVDQVIGAEKPALPPTASSTTTDRSRSPLATRLQALAPATSPAVKLKKGFGEEAAQAFQSLLLGWGDTKEAATMGKLLAGAAGSPAIYAEFAGKLGEVGGQTYWHPGHVKAAFAKRDLKALAGPIATTLAAVPDAPKKLDPVQIGQDLKDFALEWFGRDELKRLVAQLPTVLDDPFAFATAAFEASEIQGFSKGPDATRTLVKKLATEALKECDPGDRALLEQLAAI